MTHGVELRTDRTLATVFAGAAGETLRYRVRRSIDDDNYVVHDGALDREVLLRIVAFGPDMESRLRRLGELHHPGIPPVYEISRLADGRSYYTRPLDDVPTLRSWLESTESTLTSGLTLRVAEVVARVSEAMRCAHENGLTHGRLDESTVRVGAHGEVRVEEWLQVVAAAEIDDVIALRHTFEECERSIQERSASSRLLFPAELRAEVEAAVTMSELSHLLSRWRVEATDRDRRRSWAQSHTVKAATTLAQLMRTTGKLARAVERIRPLEASLKVDVSDADRTPLFALRDEVRRFRVRRAELGDSAVQSLLAALQMHDLERARSLLAEHGLDELLQAERDERPDDARRFQRMLDSFDDGRLIRERRGDGRLDMVTKPVAAEVFLYRLEVRDGRLRPGVGCRLGRTPIRLQQLPMGSYVAVLRAPGYLPTRVPIRIRRNESRVEAVRLVARRAGLAGTIHIPAGRFLLGEPPDWNSTLEVPVPREQPWLDDFMISKFPVSCRDYADYLNELAATDEAELEQRWPKPSRQLERAGDAIVAAAGIDPREPIVSICYLDAVAYARWRAERDRLPIRLPNAAEWEKAARGVDGRAFPWGDRFDPAFCNMAESLEEPHVLPVNTFPFDCSVYGVRGMGGNVGDLVDDVVCDLILTRGGNRAHLEADCRCSRSGLSSPRSPHPGIGFRLAMSLPEVC